MAFDELSLEGLTPYDVDTEWAEVILDKAGWVRGEAGIRYKDINGKRTELRMTLGMPDIEETKMYLEEHFIRYLEEAGIQVAIQPMSMEEIEKAYRSETGEIDMLYLGENFSILFDPEVLAPKGEAGSDTEKSLSAAKAEVYQMALDMVRTKPTDLAGFLRNWIAMQERITETLPLLPVYSNIYFDFFTQELHDYRITEAVTWGEAIVESYMSDIEINTGSTKNSLTDIVTEAGRQVQEANKRVVHAVMHAE